MAGDGGFETTVDQTLMGGLVTARPRVKAPRSASGGKRGASRFLGALGLGERGQSAPQGSKRPAAFRKSMKNGNCPSGVSAPSVSHSACTGPAKLSRLMPRGGSLSSTGGCSPAGGGTRMIVLHAPDSATILAKFKPVNCRF